MTDGLSIEVKMHEDITLQINRLHSFLLKFIKVNNNKRWVQSMIFEKLIIQHFRSSCCIESMGLKWEQNRGFFVLEHLPVIKHDELFLIVYFFIKLL